MESSDEISLNKILSFLDRIGVLYKFTNIEKECFLAGLFIDKGTLLIDKDKLKHVGDVMHEAGHIALMSPEERQTVSGSLDGILYPEAVEMMTLAWSYAACLEIELDPYVVFHKDGYKGDSESIVSNFQQGSIIGLPMLQWLGLTNDRIDPTQNKTVVYPKMITWIRQK
ncbi:MAG: hypothetical protein MUF45_03505 [Spirosomaceae bacterium]|jgi:hypothetical protein|nr:hypothetical protein [Spirosomataceae bacterium]